MPENTYKEAEVCPHAKHALTPCYHKDGADCLTDGCCPGCGKTINEILGRDLSHKPVLELEADVTHFRRRALDAEARCKELWAENKNLKISLNISRTAHQETQVVADLITANRKKGIAELEEQLKKSNAAYQRIFDEKTARCEYIAKLEKCNDRQREYIRKMEEKAYPKLELGQQFDFTPAESIKPESEV